MHVEAAAIQPRRQTARTWAALASCMFIFLPVRALIYWLSPEPTTGVVALREGLLLAAAAGLLLFIHYVEKLPFTSVGLGTTVWWKSVLWSLAPAAVCMAAAGVIVYTTKFTGGAHAHDLERLPLWLVVVVVFRAGFVEELFFRGYAIERLRALGLSKAAAALIPLVIFALLHYTGGPVNILLAFTLGGILTLFYLWRRDLVANMIAHFLVDFIANVVPRIAHH